MKNKIEAWQSIWKKTARNKTWNYKGFTLSIEEERDTDNRKWYHYAEKDGVQYSPDLDPYDDPVTVLQLWVDAGAPPQGRNSGSFDVQSLEALIERNSYDKEEIKEIFGKNQKQKVFAIKSIHPIKKAEFEDEGKNPLESPERDVYEAQRQYEEDKFKPPYHTAEILKDITPIFEERINSMYYADGSLAWFEYKDGKIYEVKVTTAKGSKYKDYMMSKPNTNVDPNDKINL